MDYEVESEIRKCNLCGNINSILFSKPKVFKGSDNPKVMIVGHSPAVRVHEKANDNDIISPIGIKIKELYCTNLIKCNTEMLPEDINKKDKNFIKKVFNNCSKLFEKEVEEIKPNT